MNQTAVREKRREIRRAFGVDALAVLTNRDQVIAGLRHRIAQLEAEAGFLRHRIGLCELAVAEERVICVERAAVLSKWLSRNWQGRLRWLFLGR